MVIIIVDDVVDHCYLALVVEHHYVAIDESAAVYVVVLVSIAFNIIDVSTATIQLRTSFSVSVCSSVFHL